VYGRNHSCSPTFGSVAKHLADEVKFLFLGAKAALRWWRRFPGDILPHCRAGHRPPEEPSAQ